MSPGLESVPGRDRQTYRRTDGRTNRTTIASTRLALRAFARKNRFGVNYDSCVFDAIIKIL